MEGVREHNTNIHNSFNTTNNNDNNNNSDDNNSNNDKYNNDNSINNDACVLEAVECVRELRRTLSILHYYYHYY